jgi:hypothetical protein
LVYELEVLMPRAIKNRLAACGATAEETEGAQAGGKAAMVGLIWQKEMAARQKAEPEPAPDSELEPEPGPKLELGLNSEPEPEPELEPQLKSDSPAAVEQRWCKKCRATFTGEQCTDGHAVFMYTDKIPEPEPKPESASTQSEQAAQFEAMLLMAAPSVLPEASVQSGAADDMTDLMAEMQSLTSSVSPDTNAAVAEADAGDCGAAEAELQMLLDGGSGGDDRDNGSPLAELLDDLEPEPSGDDADMEAASPVAAECTARAFTTTVYRYRLPPADCTAPAAPGALMGRRSPQAMPRRRGARRLPPRRLRGRRGGAAGANASWATPRARLRGRAGRRPCAPPAVRNMRSRKPGVPLCNSPSAAAMLTAGCARQAEEQAERERKNATAAAEAATAAAAGAGAVELAWQEQQAAVQRKQEEFLAQVRTTPSWPLVPPYRPHTFY